MRKRTRCSGGRIGRGLRFRRRCRGDFTAETRSFARSFARRETEKGIALSGSARSSRRVKVCRRGVGRISPRRREDAEFCAEKNGGSDCAFRIRAKFGAPEGVPDKV